MGVAASQFDNKGNIKDGGSDEIIDASYNLFENGYVDVEFLRDGLAVCGVAGSSS